MKVKVTELRIGNLLNYNGNNKEIGIVSEILKNDLTKVSPYKIGINHRIDIYYDIDKLKSIPLTEELLLRLEAVKLDFKDYPSYNLKGIQINFINGMWIEYVSRIEITGLHNLQNIFYFRMDEELKII